MASLAQQRCANHAEREAVARCVECKCFFCRECVAEHQERVVCAGCLRKLVAPGKQKQRGFPVIIRGLQLVAGLLLLWLGFYFVGRVLLQLPTSFHEGTLWRQYWWE